VVRFVQERQSADDARSTVEAQSRVACLGSQADTSEKGEHLRFGDSMRDRALEAIRFREVRTFRHCVVQAKIISPRSDCVGRQAFFHLRARIFSLDDHGGIAGLKAPGHAMIAWMRRLVQGRYAPAAPVARGNP
jgi:hypothetical protein